MNQPKINLGGRPKKDLPVEKIIALAKRGVPAKQIAKDYGTSYTTVWRIISGIR